MRDLLFQEDLGKRLAQPESQLPWPINTPPCWLREILVIGHKREAGCLEIFEKAGIILKPFMLPVAGNRNSILDWALKLNHLSENNLKL